MKSMDRNLEINGSSAAVFCLSRWFAWMQLLH